MNDLPLLFWGEGVQIFLVRVVARLGGGNGHFIVLDITKIFLWTGVVVADGYLTRHDERKDPKVSRI